MDKKQEFLKRLLVTFQIEAEENLKNMSANLIKLENNPTDFAAQEFIENIFRDVHSLKGSSRAVNLLEIESVAHSFEGVMSALKNNRIQLNENIFNVMHQIIDLIDDLLNSTESGINSELKERVSDALKNLPLIEAGKFKEIEHSASYDKKTKIIPDPEDLNPKPEPIEPKPVAPKPKNTSETIRVSTSKLDNMLNQVEEMLSLKLGFIQQIENLRLVLDKLNILNNESSNILSSTSNLLQTLEKKEKAGDISIEEREVIKIIQFYDWSGSYIKTIKNDLVDIRKFSVQESHSSGLKIETLLDGVKEIITVPFSMILDVFPKTVRDLSKGFGKEIDFVVKGEDTEIDRRILETIRNPLLHITRNCVDYGIEKPEIRLEKGKPQKGTIFFIIERLENSKILVKISDDGKGINIEKLKEVYIKNEGISAEGVAKIQKKELLDYIFKSGITTSDIVTDISGRGLGMAIVQEKIEQLGGTVNVESEKDKGTSFNIQLPLSLVTFRGILIVVAGNEFVVPTAKINRVQRLNKKEIKTVENKATILFEDRVIPLVSLGNILELTPKENDSEWVQVLVFGSNKKETGFLIDEIIGEQEVLVKKFNKHLARVRNISGATVLGSGKVVPILNVFDLIKSSEKPSAKEITLKIKEESAKIETNVLVVEDSITSRMLLKNILETAGYNVTTAIDGVDGFTKLKEGSFNAVVSDIQMPRMNGFDLTEKIRADKIFSEMPVVLVTSLSKSNDKERGIEVGANAYIIKSNFDQSNLLEILERLV
ncbi:MAG: hybrid sensor histidine kinase/response regulator [Prolixibacteraceae bacterium]|jgi:two-component system, chemotaxis family, sensor kinase CheA|nr:hybrid sensor histidine kinase/response regulator [Prolixibacteraceae bacterium]MBT6005596.1 hybrid sensor histidine kinase/response regulator [Prolixibacteraceae bacterium]MBT6763560.1 hybrid sensor histidine kinase/response regulator [Prolixibacteraceae bacterium]MBT6998276.1 hybrid sensor histidine kinase/response regulator [Prolixibacteraceae bacterium]MBT7396478.1 hybrid sensor histidine kinase/response regulator [Prolixibacteraceae bacterium]